MKKIHFLFDNNLKSQKLKKIILKKYINFSPSKADIFIVAGGDGYMLSILKKYYKYKKPFYGINCGSYGFLMNKYNYKELYKKIYKSKKTTINPLVLITRVKNKDKKILAINEVSLFRQSRQTASLNLKIGKKTIIKNLTGDGILVSTPAGSTAYNLSVHGPILDLDSNKLAITPISPFRPRRWKGITISENSKIHLKNLDISKRPINAVADNFEVKNVKTIDIKINKKIKFNLLYDRQSSLHKKIKIEQSRKEIL